MVTMEQFRSHFNQYNDFARGDRFRVKIEPPAALLSAYPSIAKDLTFQCESAELPGRSISTFEARTYGPTVKYPYQSTYQDITLTFIGTGNFSGLTSSGLTEKSFFDDWMELINPTQNSLASGMPYFNFEYKDKYASPAITVEHYDTNGSITYAAKFFDAFPIALNPLTLAWSDETILRIVTTFAFTRWERMTARMDMNRPSSADDVSTESNQDEILSTPILSI